METTPREILICHTEDGRKPFVEWLSNLDAKTEAIVLERIDRIEDGNFGDIAPVGDGVSELRVHLGPGYRIYFGQIGNQVHLIDGGSKRNQLRDIAAAKRFWREHD